VEPTASILIGIWVPILVAVIMGPAVIVLQRLRKENTAHDDGVHTLLLLIENKVDKVGSKIDGHIGWHNGKQG
jgi:hypothetical protein